MDVKVFITWAQENIHSYLKCSESCREKQENCTGWTWTLPSHENGGKCFHFHQNSIEFLEDSPAISASKECSGQVHLCVCKNCPIIKRFSSSINC